MIGYVHAEAPMKSTKLLAVLTIVVTCAVTGVAQITSASGDQAPPIPAADHDFIHLLSENVSPAFGSVNIRIAAPVPPGRELTVPFAFQYDSGSAMHIGAASLHPDNTSYLGRGGWNYVVPTLQMTQSWVFVGPTPPQQCFSYDGFIFGDMH